MYRKYYLEMLAKNCTVTKELIEPTLDSVCMDIEVPEDLKPEVRKL